ncbi:VOC family protein [Actinomadura sp. SCN-SB]|uniref:VOC family protein n=1 Tax=Actinomadura sp. SCN-SB TaxID=3373092 RepID=UPI0037505105
MSTQNGQDDSPTRDSGPPRLAHGVLHCNLNTGDVSAAHEFYSALLGLTRRMRTRSTEGDGHAMGIDGLTDTDTWFLYDWRGPRVAPALELVQWNTPALAERPAPSPWQTGISAIGYTMPDISAVGHTTEGPDALGPVPHRGGKAHAKRITGPDGVAVELVESGHAGSVESGATLSHLRINCSDLDASAGWYAALGFQQLAPASRLTLPGWALGTADDVEVSFVSLELPQDGTFTLELVQWHRPPGIAAATLTANSQGLYRIALATEDAGAASSALASLPERQRGGPTWIPLPGTPLGGLTVLFLKDPDDVVVELVERSAAALARRGGQEGAR